MKPEIRILGIDDLPFSFAHKTVDIIGAVMRGNHYLEGVLRSTITVDGTDASRAIADMVRRSRHCCQLRAIMIDGGALGGFNVVDGEYIFQVTGVPVMTVTANQPDPRALVSALQRHFDDWETRWEVLQKGEMHVVALEYPLYVKPFGVSIQEATEILKISIVRGAIPEPIRVAHLIATGIKTDESCGKQ
ncbi:MAG: DUF99 family protein [Candidatus Thermoplasmatota archaeon]|nr:DUF99 family protein [Candidatus Thermoplasmatota archaeon]